VSETISILCNGRPREVAAGVTVAELLAELELSPRMVAVEINLELAPRATHQNRALAAGDRIEIVSLVGGG
jgi:thiamine biosynthesis protein ThiS